MLISKDLAKAFNEQIGHEFGASLQYVSIAAHFEQRNLKLLAKLFFEQADEEKQHALKFVKYLLDTKGDLQIPAGILRVANQRGFPGELLPCKTYGWFNRTTRRRRRARLSRRGSDAS